MFEKSSALLIICEEEKDMPTRLVAEAFIRRPVIAVSVAGNRTLLVADNGDGMSINEEATHIFNEGKYNALGFIYGNAYLLERNIQWV